MNLIPPKLLTKIYTRGSLQESDNYFFIKLKNRLISLDITGIIAFYINGEISDLNKIEIYYGENKPISVNSINAKNPFKFSLAQEIELKFLSNDSHKLLYNFQLVVNTSGYKKLTINFKDQLNKTLRGQLDGEIGLKNIPRNIDDYSKSIINERIAYVKNHVDVTLNHLSKPSFDTRIVKGNCENLIGVSQVPTGIAGPIKVSGTFGNGEFLIPMATTEGTLVASYNRGIKVLNRSGGVRTVIVKDAMQRAPVMVLKSATAAYRFAQFVESHTQTIKKEAEKTSSYCHLSAIESYVSNKMCFLRFNYTTGDASGQNMVTKATYAGCQWIMSNCEIEIDHFYLESNLATDKKPSFINDLQTRGKRVIAEATIPSKILIEELSVRPQELIYHWNIGNIGAMISRTNNNGLHSVNGLTGIFIATGQDVACVAESSSAIVYSELLENGDLYLSITLPSLVVATYGGGTGLPTQKECLQIMECYGEGKSAKFAEIISAVVLAGELSLAGAISSLDWVSSHENMGRNK